MPQLDSYVFFTQVFWLVLTFLSLFFLCTSIFLPRILSSLVARSTLTSLATAPEPLAWENGLEPILSSLTPIQLPPASPASQPFGAEVSDLLADQALQELRYVKLALDRIA